MSKKKDKDHLAGKILNNSTEASLIEASCSEWETNCLAPSTVSLRRQSFETSSGIRIAPLYTPMSTPTSKEEEGKDYPSHIGFPGTYPFTRGIHPTMYRSKLWTMRQYAGFGTAEAANERYRYLLAQGTTGLSVAFDLPTQMGRDSDDARARGEVGRVGVAIDTLEDIDRLFRDIPLDQVSTSMTINSTACILLAFYLALAEKRGIPWTAVKGTVQNDILKEYIARGTYIFPPGPSLKIVTDIFEFCKKEVPGWNTISISGYHMREAGSTAVQELAFTMANAIAYVEAALTRGLGVDQFAPRVTFFFNCHNNFLEEIAKFRAARRLWAKIMKDRFGAKDSRSMMLRFHTQTAGSTLTAQQPLVNVARTTLQALAAVLGGTQSLHTNAYDEALCLPTEEAALLALRTQQVIASESGVADFVDPLGGSYAVESLTDQLEQQASDYIKRIDELGGMVKAIELGFPQREIEDASYQYQRAVETKQQEVVGVNVFLEQAREMNPVLKVDALLEETQVERLRHFKDGRNKKLVEEACARLRTEVSQGVNLMPGVIHAVKNSVTLGEISEIFASFFGAYSGH